MSTPIKLVVGTDGKAGYYGETIPEVMVEITGLVNQKMSLKDLISGYVLRGLETDVEPMVDRSQRIQVGRYRGEVPR